MPPLTYVHQAVLVPGGRWLICLSSPAGFAHGSNPSRWLQLWDLDFGGMESETKIYESSIENMYLSASLQADDANLFSSPMVIEGCPGKSLRVAMTVAQTYGVCLRFLLSNLLTLHRSINVYEIQPLKEAPTFDLLGSFSSSGSRYIQKFAFTQDAVCTWHDHKFVFWNYEREEWVAWVAEEVNVQEVWEFQTSLSVIAVELI